MRNQVSRVGKANSPRWESIWPTCTACVCLSKWKIARVRHEPVHVFVYVSTGLHTCVPCEYLPARLWSLTGSCMRAYVVCVCSYLAVRCEDDGVCVCVCHCLTCIEGLKEVSGDTSVVLAGHEAAGGASGVGEKCELEMCCN